MNRLFVMLLKDSLTEYAYDAELAGLKYNVDVSIYGINVSNRDTSIMHCTNASFAIKTLVILSVTK
jgi:hypothetical protein